MALCRVSFLETSKQIATTQFWPKRSFVYRSIGSYPLTYSCESSLAALHNRTRAQFKLNSFQSFVVSFPNLGSRNKGFDEGPDLCTSTSYPSQNLSSSFGGQYAERCLIIPPIPAPLSPMRSTLT